jgi:hypothetical protein
MALRLERETSPSHHHHLRPTDHVQAMALALDTAYGTVGGAVPVRLLGVLRSGTYVEEGRKEGRKDM